MVQCSNVVAIFVPLPYASRHATSKTHAFRFENIVWTVDIETIAEERTINWSLSHTNISIDKSTVQVNCVSKRTGSRGLRALWWREKFRAPTCLTPNNFTLLLCVLFFLLSSFLFISFLRVPTFCSSAHRCHHVDIPQRSQCAIVIENNSIYYVIM